MSLFTSVRPFHTLDALESLILSFCSDDHDCETCEDILRELERIDDEADDLDVMFVKIKDMRYAKKYGITTIPTLVFFRKRFPSVYRGEHCI